MARKGKNKKISKRKFKNKVCRNCKLCTGNFFPAFCFNKLYKQNPQKFIHIVPGRLKANKNILNLLLEGNADNLISHLSFKRVFCDTNICIGCSRSVAQILNCMGIFQNQLYVQNATKKSKKKDPVVFVFCSDDEDFKKEVNLILENNNKQQNKDK